MNQHNFLLKTRMEPLPIPVTLSSEVGGVVPKHEAPYREFNVAAAVRDVSCVTCRACDVARDRSIGRESGGGRRVCPVVEEILPKFLLLLSSAIYTFSFIRKSFLHVFLHNIFLYFRQSGSPVPGGLNRLRSRTRVQTFNCF